MGNIPEAERKAVIRRVAVSSFLGNFIEWFDFATYMYFAIIIGKVFFPESGTLGTTLTFAIFALAFVFRPLGAIFWGSLGDKKGRKWALSMSIWVMTGACFLIGLIPPYAVIGIAAPLILLVCRTVQGFSAAGEYSGAAVFLAEYAPRHRRGLYCALVPASTSSGLLLGSFVAYLSKAFMSEAMLESIGWRIPFLLAGPLGLIAHYIRTRLEDAPAFQKAAEEMEHSKEAPRPLRTVLTKYPRRLMSSIGATMLNSVGFYLVLTYPPTYLTTVVGMDPAKAQLATNIALVVYIALIFFSGHISDKVGRKRMLITACVLMILALIPAFMLFGTNNLGIVILTEVVLCGILTVNDGTIACYQAEMFPTEVRYTGAALGSNVAYVIFGGTASLIATALIEATGNAMAPAYYMMGVTAVALVILLIFAREWGGQEMDAIEKNH